MFSSGGSKKLTTKSSQQSKPTNKQLTNKLTKNQPTNRSNSQGPDGPEASLSAGGCSRPNRASRRRLPADRKENGLKRCRKKFPRPELPCKVLPSCAELSELSLKSFQCARKNTLKLLAALQIFIFSILIILQ